MSFRSTIFVLVAFLALLISFDRLGAMILRHGLDINFGLDQESDVLILGHSHITLATDKTRMEKELGVSISKYARPGVTVADRYVMAKQYLDKFQGKKLKHVLYGVDQFTFSDKGLSENSYALFYPWMDDAGVSAYVKDCASAQQFWIHKLFHLTRYTDETIYASISGFCRSWKNRKHSVMNTSVYDAKLAKKNERTIHIEDSSYELLYKTIRMFTDKGIRVTLVNLPTYYRLHEYETEKYAAICNIFSQIACENEYVEYLDLNDEICENHEFFRDALHVNYKGQQATTDKLIQSLAL